MKSQNKVGKPMKKGMIVAVMAQVMALFFGASVASAAGSIAVGGLQLVPEITLGESRNDNIFSQEPGKGIKKSWITTIKPSISLSADDGANKYQLGYNLSKGIYHQSHEDDFIDQAANFQANLGLSRKLTVDFNVDYNLKHDARGSTFTGGAAAAVLTPDKYHETNVGASVNYGTNAHVILSGDYSNKRYSNNRTRTMARDLDTIGGIAEFDYDLTGKTSAVLEARYTRFNYQYETALVNLDSNEQVYFTGLNWDATAKTSGKVRVGYTKKNFARASLTDVGFFSWEIGVEWLPMSYSSWTLKTSSMPYETDGSGSFIKNTGVDLAWDHAWSKRLHHKATLSYSKAAYQGGSVRVDNITKASASVNYQWLRWLAVQPLYEYTNNSSNTVKSSYKQNIWTLNLIGTL